MSIINFTVQYDLYGSDTDGPDVGEDADLIPLIGTITFTPLLSDAYPLQAAGYTPRPAGIKLRVFEGRLGTDGQLRARDSGMVGVRLFANDAVLDLDHLYYRVDFDVRTPMGEKVFVKGGVFEAPSTDTVINLAAVLPSPTSALSALVRKVVYSEDILDSTALGRALITSPTPATARAVIGAPSLSDSAADKAATAAALKAHIYIDHPAGIYQRNGADVLASSIITHNTPTYTLYSQTRTYPYLNLQPATTNKFPVGSGGSAGSIDTTGALYTGWTVDSPNVLPSNVNIKTIVTGEAFNVEFAVTLDPYKSDPPAGFVEFISPAISGCNEVNHLSFVMNAMASDLDAFWVEAGWDSDFDATMVLVRAAGGGGRLNFELPASGQATDNLRLRFKNANQFNELAVRAHVREFSLCSQAAPGGLLRDVPPVVTATATAQDVTVQVSPGNYYAFAWTDERGVIGEPVTVAEGASSFSLRSTLGNGKVTKIAVWRKTDYVDGAIEVLEPPVFEPVGKFESALLERASDKITSASRMAYSGPAAPAFFVATNRFGRSKVVIDPGQHDPLGRVDQCRAEVIGKTYSHGVDLWTSFAFKTDALMAGLNVGAGSYAIIWQWHDGWAEPNPISPSLYLMLWPNGILGLWTISTTDPLAPYSGVLRWHGQTIVEGWNRVVMRANLSQSGGGQLGMWLNGENVYPWQNTPVGHNKAGGARPQYGYYGVNGRKPVVMERANMEFGVRDLSSRITNPLPI